MSASRPLVRGCVAPAGPAAAAATGVLDWRAAHVRPTAGTGAGDDSIEEAGAGGGGRREGRPSLCSMYTALFVPKTCNRKPHRSGLTEGLCVQHESVDHANSP
jgi:hypothetical protein